MKIRTLFAWLVAFVAFALPAAGQTNSPPQLMAIKAGKIVDPETGKTGLNQVILVEGKKINRHRGSGRPLSPATPPDMRVRIRRFRGLRRPIEQIRKAKRGEVGIG